MTFDEKLVQAFANTAKEREEQILTVEKEHKFSLSYRLWEYRTLKSLEKNRFNPRWNLRRARYAVVSIMTAVVLLLGTTVYAVGAAIGRYTFDTKPAYSKLFIENIL